MSLLCVSDIWDENVRTETSGARVDALVHAAGISATPVLVDSDTVQTAGSRLRLVNDADVPMKVAGHFQFDEQLRPDPYGLDLVVPPNSTREFPVTLDAVKPVNVNDLGPMLLHYTITYEIPDEPALEIKGTQKFIIEPRLDVIPHRGAPVVVDGKLDEWKSLPFVCEKPAQIRVSPENWRGPADCSFRFGVEYDEHYLYIGVETTDDKLVLDPKKETWDQDDVEVRIDARPESETAYNNGRVPDDLQTMQTMLAVLVSPGETPEQTILSFPDKLPKDLKAVCVKTAKGHTTEMAIPAAYLDAKQGGPWKSFRLNVAVMDVDGPSRPNMAYILWKPDWRLDETYPGSGTFQRGQ
ncbi:hypothetical protein HQ590_04640 [bacterium]|nr:hypothetical protein [bacterium]